MLRRSIVTASALLSLATPARAQSVFETLYQDFVHAVPSDAWHVVTSPLRADRGDLDAFLWIAGSALALGVFDGEIQSAMREHPNALPIQLLEPFTERGPVPLRNDDFGLAVIGDTENILLFSAAVYAVGLVSGSDAIREAGLGCATADALNSLFRHLLYDTVSRDRPGLKQPDESIVLNDDPYRFAVPGGDWNKHSFFGGHAANPMSCATFWNRRFELGWLEPVLYGAAAAVGLARMVDERHWASDTWLGLAFGYAMGKTVANRYLHREREREAERGSSSRARGARASLIAEPMGDRLLLGGRVAF